MNSIEIGAAAAAAIKRHARHEYPLECCGILIGTTLSNDQDRITSVDSVTVADNIDPSDRTRKFAIAPELLLRIHKSVRKTDFEVVGYYHSHPDGPAVPSDTDRLAAWPGVSYLILGVDNSRGIVFRCWRLTGDGDRFREERVEKPIDLDLD